MNAGRRERYFLTQYLSNTHGEWESWGGSWHCQPARSFGHLVSGGHRSVPGEAGGLDYRGEIIIADAVALFSLI